MGEGALWKLFFESPGTANDSGRHPNISAGKGRS